MKQRVERKCKKLGAVIDTSGGEVLIEAPEGHHFNDGDVIHEYVCSPWSSEGETMADMWKLAWERLEQATVEPCTSDCSWWPQKPRKDQP